MIDEPNHFEESTVHGGRAGHADQAHPRDDGFQLDAHRLLQRAPLFDAHVNSIVRLWMRVNVSPFEVSISANATG